MKPLGVSDLWPMSQFIFGKDVFDEALPAGSKAVIESPGEAGIRHEIVSV